MTGSVHGNYTPRNVKDQVVGLWHSRVDIVGGQVEVTRGLVDRVEEHMVTDFVGRGYSKNIHPCRVAGPLKVDEITNIQVIMRALGEGVSHNKERYTKGLGLRFMRCLVDTKVVIL